MITLYTIHCPACKILEGKLDKVGIEYIMIDDENEVQAIGESINWLSPPYLKVDDEVMKLADANKWVNKIIKQQGEA